MYSEYSTETYADGLHSEQVEQTSDIQLPPAMNTLLLVTWVVICLIGFAIIFYVKQPVFGIAVINHCSFMHIVISHMSSPILAI